MEANSETTNKIIENLKEYKDATDEEINKEAPKVLRDKYGKKCSLKRNASECDLYTKRGCFGCCFYKRII